MENVIPSGRVNYHQKALAMYDAGTLKAGPAFVAYLLNAEREMAISHLWECLKNGSSSNEAWILMHDIHGENWSFKTGEVLSFLDATIEKLKIKLTA